MRRNPNPPAAAASSVAKLGSELPGKRRGITDAEFNVVCGADPADLERVSKWAEKSKLKVLDRSVAKRRILVEGTIQDIEQAFGVQLNEYDHPEHGHFRGREGEVHVPNDLAGVIEGVFGLDTRRVGQSRRRKIAGPRVKGETLKATPPIKGATHPTLASLTNQWPGTFFPPQVSQLYSYPAQFDGTGQNVAIFAFNGPPSPDPRGGYNLTALKTYFEQVLGGKTPSITDVVVQGPVTIQVLIRRRLISAATPRAKSCSTCAWSDR